MTKIDTQDVAPLAPELKLEPSDKVIFALLNYSKSIDTIKIDNQIQLLNFN